MKCPQCRQPLRGARGTCGGCGYDLRGGASRGHRLDRATAAGPIGPLDDFVLREARSSPDRSRTSSGQTPGRPTGRRRRSAQSDVSRPSLARVATSRGLGASAPKTARALDLSFPTAAPTTGDPRRPDDSLGCLGRRLVAWTIDTVLLLGINLVVIYFTLRLAGLSIAEADQLPLVPLIVFLLLFDLGYLIVLTAFGGQTIGKMALGLRVEQSGGQPVGLRGALARTAAYGISVLPAGLGLVGVFLHRRRTLHDLIAKTRVVKVS